MEDEYKQNPKDPQWIPIEKFNNIDFEIEYLFRVETKRWSEYVNKTTYYYHNFLGKLRNIDIDGLYFNLGVMARADRMWTIDKDSDSEYKLITHYLKIPE